jgi:hypothetical protein
MDTFFTRSGSSPGKAAEFSPDVLVVPDGSVVLFQLCSRSAHVFVSENIHTESWQWLGDAAFAVDHRFAPELAGAMIEAGLDVRR